MIEALAFPAVRMDQPNLSEAWPASANGDVFGDLIERDLCIPETVPLGVGVGRLGTAHEGAA
jgi:hypothetical protein